MAYFNNIKNEKDGRMKQVTLLCDVDMCITVHFTFKKIDIEVDSEFDKMINASSLVHCRNIIIIVISNIWCFDAWMTYFSAHSHDI